MWEKVIQWFLGLGEHLFQFTQTTAAQVYKKYAPICANAVIQAATTPGLTGRARAVLAGQLLLMEVPGLVQYIVDTVIQMAYAEYKYQQELQEKIDTDGDGIPDYKDLCKDVGIPPGGCVTVDGCPDSDCDGMPDKFDPSPKDPTIK